MEHAIQNKIAAWKLWQLPKDFTVADCNRMALRMDGVAKRQQLLRDKKAALAGAAACRYWARRLVQGGCAAFG